MMDFFCRNIAASSFCDDKKFTFTLQCWIVLDTDLREGVESQIKVGTDVWPGH